MSDRWVSPEWVKKMFETFHDPCPINYTIDAFSYDWCEHHDQVYVNPPYSNPLPWVEKALYEIQRYPDSIIVMLLKHDPSTKWFRLLHASGAKFLMIGGRLKFYNDDLTKKSASPFPSVIAVIDSTTFKGFDNDRLPTLEEWI